MNAVLRLPAAPTVEQLIADLPIYRHRLLRILRARRIQPDMAEDLAQEVYAIVIRKLRHEGLADPRNLLGYLAGTAVKVAIEYRRRLRTRQRFLIGEEFLMYDVRDESQSPEERADTPLRAREVRKMLQRLPVPRDREILVRIDMNEEPRAAVRQSLGMNELQFNNAVYRARWRLALICAKGGVQP